MVNKSDRRTDKAVLSGKTFTTKGTEKNTGGMSMRHEFLLIKDRHWGWFNILTAGLVKGREETIPNRGSRVLISSARVVRSLGPAFFWIRQTPDLTDRQPVEES